MIAKVPRSGTVEAGSFKPVRKHPVMLLCSEPGLNEAQPCSALQPHACSTTSCLIPNSSGAQESNFPSECSAQSFSNGRESSLTHIDGNLVMKLAPTSFSCPTTSPEHSKSCFAGSSQDVMFSRPWQPWKVVFSHVVSQLKLCPAGVFM